MSLNLYIFYFRHHIEDLDNLSCTDKVCAWKNSHKGTLNTYTKCLTLLEHKGFVKPVTKKFKCEKDQNERTELKILKYLQFSAFSKDQ